MPLQLKEELLWGEGSCVGMTWVLPVCCWRNLLPPSLTGEASSHSWPLSACKYSPHPLSSSVLLFQKYHKYLIQIWFVFRSWHLASKHQLCVTAPPYVPALSCEPIHRKCVKSVLWNCRVVVGCKFLDVYAGHLNVVFCLVKTLVHFDFYTNTRL